MLFAERAVLVERKPLGVVLFVLHGIIVAILALGAFKRNFCSVRGSHFSENSMQKNHTGRGVFLKSSIKFPPCQ